MIFKKKTVFRPNPRINSWGEKKPLPDWLKDQDRAEEELMETEPEEITQPVRIPAPHEESWQNKDLANEIPLTPEEVMDIQAGEIIPDNPVMNKTDVESVIEENFLDGIPESSFIENSGGWEPENFLDQTEQTLFLNEESPQQPISELPQNEVIEEIPTEEFPGWLRAIVYDETEDSKLAPKENNQAGKWFMMPSSDQESPAYDDLEDTVKVSFPHHTSQSEMSADSNWITYAEKIELSAEIKSGLDVNFLDQLKSDLDIGIEPALLATRLTTWLNQNEASKVGWELLGDLHIRADQPEKAFEAYSKAMTLNY